MKKYILLFAIMAAAFTASAQRAQYKELKVKGKITLGDRPITKFYNDSTFTGADSLSLPTTWAVYNFILNHAFGGVVPDLSGYYKREQTDSAIAANVGGSGGGKVERIYTTPDSLYQVVEYISGVKDSFEIVGGGSTGGDYHLPYSGDSNDYLGGDTAYHALPSIPVQFNPIAGTGVTLSGTYPNITFDASGGGGGAVNSLTTTGTSGAATLNAGVLNIPNYATGGGGSAISDSIQVYTSGATITVTNGVNVFVVNPSTLVSTLTVTLPATPSVRNDIEIYFGGTITAGSEVVTTITIVGSSGQTLFEALVPDTMSSGEYLSYKWIPSLNRWYAKR